MHGVVLSDAGEPLVAHEKTGAGLTTQRVRASHLWQRHELAVRETVLHELRDCEDLLPARTRRASRHGTRSRRVYLFLLERLGQRLESRQQLFALQQLSCTRRAGIATYRHKAAGTARPRARHVPAIATPLTSRGCAAWSVSSMDNRRVACRRGA